MKCRRKEVMSAQVSIRKSFQHGFVLDEQELRRIYNILVQQMNESNSHEDFDTTFTMVFKNKITVEKSSIEDVITENNGGLWEIESLEINLRSKNPSRTPRIIINFQKEEYRSISYTIEGEDRNWVYLTSSQLEERITKIKQFTLSSNARFGLLILSTFPIITLLLFLSALLFPAHVSLSWPTGDIILTIVVIALLAVGVIAYFHFFSLFNFCWGDYTAIFERKRSIGKFILLGVLVVLLLGVIGGIIANYLTVRTGIGH